MPNMGKIVRYAAQETRQPHRKMQVRDAGLAPVDALFTAGQQRVLGLLFGHPGETYSVSEIIGATGAGSGAAQREIERLVQSALVTVHTVGNQKRYQANPYALFYDELVGIIRKATDAKGVHARASSRAVGARKNPEKT
jgi:hypothetical protein